MVVFIRLLFLASWFSLGLASKQSIKRYLPVTFFAGLYAITVVLIGNHYNFWETKDHPKKRMWNHLTLVLGPFTLANFWIFNFTYGKFKRYFLTNIINNIVYGFAIIPLLRKANYLLYERFTKFHHIIFTMTFSLVFYRFQMFFEKLSPNKGHK